MFSLTLTTAKNLCKGHPSVGDIQHEDHLMLNGPAHRIDPSGKKTIKGLQQMGLAKIS